MEVQNRTNYRLNGSMPIMNFSQVPMENKARVEVLKGASALYYGFTAPSGIVNYVTLWRGQYTLAEYLKRMRSVPDCRIEAVQGAGHMLHHDQPQAVARLMESFL